MIGDGARVLVDVQEPNGCRTQALGVVTMTFPGAGETTLWRVLLDGGRRVTVREAMCRVLVVG